ncbi:oligoribonuclease [Umboniibacter marinipuniceus]|uniref:Oligoribonuclease n=1 Tax=Umboniibacter marinipuniceus TaxID=569599 RepID=A0A3M0AEZ2_9GAMM|nr:oligoribonuclease [Umboniibacter marinipuniceus]RMA82259.1 oligoribonuclease [Umboniibacter marinipuniceus]
MSADQRLIWIDLEMTGLEPEIDTILEIATIVTDAQLNVLAEGPSIAIRHSAEALSAMNEWCVEHHGQSGLTERCLNSEIDLAQAEAMTLEFLRQWVPSGVSPICGNSVGQDRRFLVKYMPLLESYFHYRMIDVSTLKELARRWSPATLDQVKKKGAHLALDDIHDSIAELVVYREQLFKL